MTYYRILVYSAFDADAPYILDLEKKENAVNLARFLMDIGLSKSEKFDVIDVYEMHDNENRSESVLSVSLPQEHHNPISEEE